jgi:hypothetical protein
MCLHGKTITLLTQVSGKAYELNGVSQSMQTTEHDSPPKPGTAIPKTIAIWRTTVDDSVAFLPGALELS